MAAAKNQKRDEEPLGGCMTEGNDKQLKRRALLGGMGMAAAGLGVGAANAEIGEFEPARHDVDAWMGGLSGTHRAFIDSATAFGGAEALHFARNILNAHGNAYGGSDEDYAMIVCLRHYSTVFAYSDAVWKKYAKEIYADTGFADPQTGNAPDINLMRAENRTMLPNGGATIDYLVGRGVQFAICNAATRYFASVFSAAGHGDADDIHKELVASAIPNSRFVSAGVMAVTRAQEYGYSLLYAG